ncbi:MAG: PD-(D/E)XK nuclease family protein [Patescibacteria group bacterium]|nr:PD-(D/E)XK nuclease family protein [Patescibacteria group bacterium]
MTEDVADSVWKLFGTSFHLLMEKHGGKNALIEERVYATIKGVKVSGCPDRVDQKYVWDWKTTKAYSRKSRLLEWSKQVNAYNYLLHVNGFEMEGLKILALYKDWRRSEALKDPSYPEKDVQIIDLPKWNHEDTKTFLEKRVELLEKNQEVPDDYLPECSAEEMWTRDEKFLVKKVEGKVAIKGGVKDTLKDAEEMVAAQTKPEAYRIEHKPGIRARCEGYCPVSEFCSQNMKYKIENGQEDHEKVEVEA